TPNRLMDSLGLVGPVTSWVNWVGPRRTGTVPSSPVIHGGIPYTDPITGSRDPERAWPTDPVSSCWTSEPERSCDPRARDVDPTGSDDASEPVEPAEPAESVEPSDPRDPV